MEVINLRKQTQVNIPAQAFVDVATGVVIVQPTLNVTVTYMDFCSGNYASQNTALVLTGSATITRGCEYYAMDMSVFGNGPTGLNRNIGVFRPGHVFGLSFQPVSGDPAQFKAVNVGPFGVSDERLTVLNSESPVWTAATDTVMAVWSTSGWRYRRDFAVDAKWASPMYLCDSGNAMIDMNTHGRPDAFEYLDADPDKIHYIPGHFYTMPFDGMHLFCHGVARIQDGTPWTEADLSGFVTQSDAFNCADMSQLTPFGDGVASATVFKTNAPYWWAINFNFTDSGNPATKANFKNELDIAVKVFISDGQTQFSTTSVDAIKITQNRQNIELLPYRYRISAGVWWQEFGKMDVASTWYTTGPSSDTDVSGVICRRLVTASSGGGLPVPVSYWNPTMFGYGSLTWM